MLDKQEVKSSEVFIIIWSERPKLNVSQVSVCSSRSWWEQMSAVFRGGGVPSWSVSCGKPPA